MRARTGRCLPVAGLTQDRFSSRDVLVRLAVISLGEAAGSSRLRLSFSRQSGADRAVVAGGCAAYPSRGRGLRLGRVVERGAKLLAALGRSPLRPLSLRGTSQRQLKRSVLRVQVALRAESVLHPRRGAWRLPSVSR